jgi:hypothetical protein
MNTILPQRKRYAKKLGSIFYISDFSSRISNEAADGGPSPPTIGTLPFGIVGSPMATHSVNVASIIFNRRSYLEYWWLHHGPFDSTPRSGSWIRVTTVKKLKIEHVVMSTSRTLESTMYIH